MLKFVLVAFLFLGLAVQGKETEEQAQKNQLVENVMNFNEKDTDAVQEDSQENVETEEDSEEEEQSDYSGAVSEENDKEFDQEDDVGSKAMLEEREESDDSCAWCHLPKCSNFKKWKRVFMIWRSRCVRCIYRRGCKQRCNAFFRFARYGYKKCRAKIVYAYRYWNAKLRANYKQLCRAYYYIRRFIYYRNRYWAAAGRMHLNVLKRRKAYFLAKYRWAQARQVWAYHRYRYYAAKYHHFRRVYLHILRRSRNCALARKYQRIAHNFLTAYYNMVKYRVRMIHYRNHMARWYHITIRQIKYVIIAYRFHRAAVHWIKVRNNLLARRRYLLKVRSQKAWAIRKMCNSYYYKLKKNCLVCRGKCGGNCWNMHHYYGIMVLYAHRCQLQKYLCKRRYAYLKAYYAYNKACHYCWKKTPNYLKYLYCASRCGARYKFLRLYYYYNKKCRS